MARKSVNPIDPSTGKRKRGRPVKAKLPIEVVTLPASEPEVKREPAKVRSADPREDVKQSTESAREWKRKFKGLDMLTVPQEALNKYPDGDFCWSRNNTADIGQYRTQFGYELVEVDKALPGQSDTTVKHRDLILMVRPLWMRKAHNEALEESALSQSGDSDPRAKEAEREAMSELRRLGIDRKDLSTFTEEDTVRPADVDYERKALKQLYADDPDRPKGARGRGSKFWGGGIPA